MKVYIVQHVHEFDDDREDIKLIGIYSSIENAQGAVQRLGDQPGFRDTPEGFEIDTYILDHDNWTEGYVTVKY